MILKTEELSIQFYLHRLELQKKDFFFPMFLDFDFTNKQLQESKGIIDGLFRQIYNHHLNEFLKGIDNRLQNREEIENFPFLWEEFYFLKVIFWMKLVVTDRMLSLLESQVQYKMLKNRNLSQEKIPMWGLDPQILCLNFGFFRILIPLKTKRQ